MFVHLHNHSHYSILEGLPKPKDYVKKAIELGMSGVAITDTANIYGCHELYKECKNAGITPIMGTEIFIISSLDSTLEHKLVLLAKSELGFKNIIALTSKANLGNPGQKAKINFDDLKEYSSDIICLSGPITGEIPYYILSGKSEEEVLSRIQEYQGIFGVENYFLELMYHEDVPKQKLVTDTLITFSQKYNIPVVATNNCAYIEKEDAESQDVIQALGTGHELENPDRKSLRNGDYSFLTEAEMQKLFGFIPEALTNTGKIAQMINVNIETGGILIPVFELPESDQAIYEKAQAQEIKQLEIKKLDSSEWYLRYLSFKGLNWRFDYGLSEETIFEFIKKLDKPALTKPLVETSPQELKDLSLTYYTDHKKELLGKLEQTQQDYIERLEYELAVIHEMGFNGYFLIVADYINWARENDIPVGPGRGSAAGSLMAYLSGITDLDPIFYELLFERFLNPARISMPDIDTDFADDGKDRVIEYCRNKYGSDRVAQICTFGTFAARAAVKDVGRVMGIPFAEMNELVKLIPEKPGTKLAGALVDAPEFAEAYESNPKYKDIIDKALKIEGNVRQLGVHACGVIIAPEPMTNFTALQHPPKDPEAIVTQYSAYPLEDLGLLKMDFLGLRNLTIIKNAQKIVEENGGEAFDILEIDTNNLVVLDVFARGDTTGVFQFESDGMRKYLRDLKPNAFNDIIAMVSLYRPGPLAYIPTYIERKYGREEIKYMTDDLVAILDKKYSPEEIEEQKQKLENDLKSILDVTYGIAVYQEQLMFIVQYMAGFSLGEADLLRRGVGKKKLDVIEALKKEFITKSANFKGYKPETSKYIYEEMIQPAANYSFNKSHAACYAFIAYQTAYLKAYHPTEFLTAVMMSDEENMERIVLEVGECESKGIHVLPPSVNGSMKHFTYIDEKNIRFGFKAIKGIGDGPINRIIAARKEVGGIFESLEQFVEVCGTDVINKRTLEALILSGAIDDLGERRQMFESIQNMISFCKKDEKKKSSSQIGLFDNSDEFEDILELEKVTPYTFEEKLRGEKEMIGFYVSGHPLDGLGRYCLRRSNNTKKLKMTMEELLELDKKTNPDNYLPEEEKKKLKEEKKAKNIQEDKKDEVIQAVGVIEDIRKIVTKTGKTMMFLQCAGFDYYFEVVIFPRDIDTFKDKVEIDKIIIVNGVLNVNFEYGRKSIAARDMKIVDLGQVRDQSRDLGLFDNKKRIIHKYAQAEELEENFEEDLEEKINENKSEPEDQLSIEESKNLISKYIITIPASAKKEDLHDLKSFLTKQSEGSIEIYIDLNGQEIFTKASLKDLEELKKWENEKWCV